MTTYPPASQPAPAQAKNGFGITALVLAIIGLVFGLVPLTGFIALILGALAVLFGLLGFGRVRKGHANNKGITIAGTTLGALAVVLGIWGMTILFGAFDELVNEFDSIGDGNGRGSAHAERGNPVPVGQTARVGEWEVTFNATTLDATAEVLAQNPFNDPPAEGRQFVMGDVTIAYVGESTGVAWIDLNFKVLGAAGNTYGTGMQDSCGVIPNPLSDHGELFPGATATAKVCTSVPTEQVEGATWIVEQPFTSNSRVFFAIH